MLLRAHEGRRREPWLRPRQSRQQSNRVMVFARSEDRTLYPQRRWRRARDGDARARYFDVVQAGLIGGTGSVKAWGRRGRAGSAVSASRYLTHRLPEFLQQPVDERFHL